jgi:hypothetical protein
MRRKYARYTTLPPLSLCVIRYPHGGSGKIAFVFPIRLYFQPHMLRQVWFHQWGKKKKAQEFWRSLERLDAVVKDMIVPLEF